MNIWWQIFLINSRYTSDTVLRKAPITIIEKTAALTLVKKTSVTHNEGESQKVTAERAPCSQSAVSADIHGKLSVREKCGRKRCAGNKDDHSRESNVELNRIQGTWGNFTSPSILIPQPWVDLPQEEKNSVSDQLISAGSIRVSSCWVKLLQRDHEQLTLMEPRCYDSPWQPTKKNKNRTAYFTPLTLEILLSEGESIFRRKSKPDAAARERKLGLNIVWLFRIEPKTAGLVLNLKICSDLGAIPREEISQKWKGKTEEKPGNARG